MKTKFLILLFWACTTTSIFAQSVITVQHGNSTSIYSTFDAAVAGAQHGDYIYLPGGFFSGAQVNIDKKLTIIGAGYHPDSSIATVATTCNFEIVFTVGSDSSLLSGVSNSNTIRINTSNITIQRCLLDHLILGNGNFSNIRILENIFQGTTSLSSYVNPASYPNCLISKNIIYGDIVGINYHSFFNLVSFQNNVFLKDGYIYGGYNLGNCSFENNIFFKNQRFLYSNAARNTIE